ncbi:hypothetical protein GCM10027317_33320 [Massilia agri]
MVVELVVGVVVDELVPVLLPVAASLLVVPVLVPLLPDAPVVPVLPELIDDDEVPLVELPSVAVELHAARERARRPPSRAPWKVLFIRILLVWMGVAIMRGGPCA